MTQFPEEKKKKKIQHRERYFEARWTNEVGL